MTALAHTIGRRETATASLATDVALIVLGSLIVAGLAQLSYRLPFTPVPVTGQTLGVLLVGASLGAVRGGSAMLLYLFWGAIGLPFFAGGESGSDLLTFAGASGGYLWGFVVAGVVVGRLSERGWDRKPSSAIGAMLIGEIIIFGFGVPWLAAAADMAGDVALEQGLYPFVLGDLVKLLIAAGLLPGAWRFVRRGKLGPGTFRARY